MRRQQVWGRRRSPAPEPERTDRFPILDTTGETRRQWQTAESARPKQESLVPLPTSTPARLPFRCPLPPCYLVDAAWTEPQPKVTQIHTHSLVGSKRRLNPALDLASCACSLSTHTITLPSNMASAVQFPSARPSAESPSLQLSPSRKAIADKFAKLSAQSPSKRTIGGSGQPTSPFKRPLLNTSRSNRGREEEAAPLKAKVVLNQSCE